jgi:enoyl-CoA hydratase/carnithine racemase
VARDPPSADLGALIGDLIDLGGAGVEVVEFDQSPGTPTRRTPGVVRIGVRRAGPTPGEDFEAFDILLSADPTAAEPWVGLADESLDAALRALRQRIEAQPIAASVAAQVLGMSLGVSFDSALGVESLAYSMLLASAGFRTWRAAMPPRERANDDGPRVTVDDVNGVLQIRLTRPDARNAFDARMRDELEEALAFAVYHHPDRPPVALSGEGPAFSAGGDLDEFGSADDVGAAHLIRSFRSPARLVHALEERITVYVHGACIGAGIEVPAAAGSVIARPGAFFRLPEVSMGLIPGAGGTASIPRRIGRHRACYMAISGADIDLATALDWGLVDAIDEAS